MNTRLFLFLVFFISSVCQLGCSKPQEPPAKTAAMGLLKRVLANGSENFEVELIAAEHQKDVFELESVRGKIVLRGNNAVAIAAALNWYLKYYLHKEFSTEAALSLPAKLVVVPRKVRLRTAYAYRAYLNYCTFSYTMAWWDWKRWEKEIDWMALHGVNMPLAITGQEAVWQNTLRKFRMSDREITSFLVGPAFFAWQFMGNIEGWGGPLPQSWIDSHVQLGRQILARERELGMRPILQGFTGYVPRLLKDKYPGAKIAVKGDWYGVPPGSGQLDPLDPLFAQMGRVFLGEQERLFGTNHLYAADPFHEGEPPVKGDDYLGKVGEQVYSVTAGVDPKAVIVMQTWSLRRVLAKSIPSEKIIFMDLVGNNAKKFDGFWGRPWIAGILHNYGGRVFMGGNLNYYASNAAKQSGTPLSGNLQGIGIFPEAIGQNPVVYELGSELTWHHEPVALQDWIEHYILARYGLRDTLASRAWQILRQTVYGQQLTEPSMESPICARPSLQVSMAAPNGSLERQYDQLRLWDAYKILLDARALKGSDNYNYDLVDVARQCLADLSCPVQREITAAYEAGDATRLRQASVRFLELIDDFDRLLATRKEFLLGKWLEQAKAWGDSPLEKAIYERNARMLITTWGPVTSQAVQYDYSNRQWAGLISGYYRVRWKMFLDYLDKQPSAKGRFSMRGLKLSYGRPAYDANTFYQGMADFERSWAYGNQRYPSRPAGDPVQIAGQLYDKWRPTAGRFLKAK